MRALILVLAAAVVGLAVSIVIHVDRRPGFVQRSGRVFHVGGLIADGQPGESAFYREKSSGRSIEFKLEASPPMPPFASPFKTIRRLLRDERGRLYDGPTANVAYDHKVTEHGFLPLMAPEVSQALDRVWIIRSIRPERLVLRTIAELGGRSVAYDCWRVDLIDPALPAGKDTVVAWVDKRVPVYGVLKWKRAGETWEFQSGRFPVAKKRP